MSISRKLSFTLFSFVIVFLFLNPSTVSAESGESAILHLKVNVWTEMRSMYSNSAQGKSILVNSTVPVKEGEIWDKNTLLRKVAQYAEPELKKKTGQKYSILDVINSPNKSNYFEDQNGVWNISGKPQEYIKLEFSPNYSTEIIPDHSATVEYSITVNVFANKGPKLTGWKAFPDGSRYYENGKYKTGLQKVGKTTYLFNESGGKQTGWRLINGEAVYFNEENGGMWTGKRKVGETTYLFDSNGHKLYGWHRLNGKDYYFDEKNGGMWTGKRKVGKTVYLFHNDGYKQYGWHIDFNMNPFKYYFDPDYGGGMITGFRKVGKGYYYFDEERGHAKMREGITINNHMWDFNENGVGRIIY